MLKPYIASLANALLLIAFGLWAYFGSETPSVTALIPVFFGVVIIALNGGLRKENKVVAHIVVILTVLVLGGLIKPLAGAIGRGDSLALFRVFVMIISTLWALIAFVKSFMDARK